MRRRHAIWLAGVVLAAAALGGLRLLRPRPALPTAVEVQRGPLEVWSVYSGYIESREVRNVTSQLGGPATVVEMVPDGARVQAGDVLVRFDAMQWERDVLRLERDCDQARQDLDGLLHAKLPLELTALELSLADAGRQCSNEVQILADSRDLLAEDLIAAQEVAQQAVRVEAAQARFEAAREQLDRTRRFLHPAQAERAKIQLHAVEQELQIARRQMDNCVVRASADGMVAYKSAHVGVEFRTVRPGDTIYRNQPILTLSDMSNLVMRCDVPESELTRVSAGSPAQVHPLAYPELVLRGAVESVGSMAQAAEGRGGSLRYFNVVIGLEQADERVRSGMSAEARVLSYAAPGVLRVPRAAVWWEGGRAWCQVLRGRKTEAAPITTGMANEMHVEVLEGLAPGDRVVVP